MDDFQDYNVYYNIVIQGINRSNTSTYQELYIYPKREFIIYYWYWYMAYTCAIDCSDVKFVFPELAKTVFKSGEAVIDSKVSQMFWEVYERFYGIVKQYKNGE